MGSQATQARATHPRDVPRYAVALPGCGVVEAVVGTCATCELRRQPSRHGGRPCPAAAADAARVATEARLSALVRVPRAPRRGDPVLDAASPTLKEDAVDGMGNST